MLTVRTQRVSWIQRKKPSGMEGCVALSACKNSEKVFLDLTEVTNSA